MGEDYRSKKKGKQMHYYLEERRKGGRGKGKEYSSEREEVKKREALNSRKKGRIGLIYGKREERGCCSPSNAMRGRRKNKEGRDKSYFEPRGKPARSRGEEVAGKNIVSRTEEGEGVIGRGITNPFERKKKKPPSRRHLPTSSGRSALKMKETCRS